MLLLRCPIQFPVRVNCCSAIPDFLTQKFLHRHCLRPQSRRFYGSTAKACVEGHQQSLPVPVPNLAAFVPDAIRRHRRCQRARLNRRTGSVYSDHAPPATPMDQRVGRNTHLLVTVRFTAVTSTTAGDQKNRRLGYPPCRVDMKTISSSSCTSYSPSPSNSQSVSLIRTRIPGRLG